MDKDNRLLVNAQQEVFACKIAYIEAQRRLMEAKQRYALLREGK